MTCFADSWDGIHSLHLQASDRSRSSLACLLLYMNEAWPGFGLCELNWENWKRNTGAGTQTAVRAGRLGPHHQHQTDSWQQDR